MYITAAHLCFIIRYNESSQTGWKCQMLRGQSE